MGVIMKKNTKMKSFLSIAAVSAFMLVTLAGCGDGNGSTGTGDAVQAGVTSTSNTGTSKNTTQSGCGILYILNS